MALLREDSIVDLETVLHEKEQCQKVLTSANTNVLNLQTEYDNIEKRIELLATIDRFQSSEFVKRNLRLAVEKRTDTLSKLNAAHSNVAGYGEILEVLERIEKELA